MSELGKSISNSSLTDIESLIDNLAPELLEAMKTQHILLLGVKDINKNISKAIYDAKKEELIKPLRTQLDFRVPDSLLKNKTEEVDTIKKDIMFYKKAYEDEAASINKIIKSTNNLNHELLEPLSSIKSTLKDYHEGYKKNVINITQPYNNKKVGLDKINVISNQKNEKNEFGQKVSEVNDEINNYQQQSIIFFQMLSTINKDLSEDINSFIDTFKDLVKSVNDLKKKLTEGFGIFENSTPEFEELDNKERIKKAMDSIISPLEELTKLININEEMLTKAQENKSQQEVKKDKGLAFKMLTICEDLKNKAKNITEKINQARLKVNLNTIEYKPIEIEVPEIENIEKNIGEIKEKIKETDKKNNTIKKQIITKIKEDINKRRLDILFIIDSTNSANTHLESIKKKFNEMIKDICSKCPTALIYIGFIGYTDFSELDLGDNYIDIDFTDEKEEISKKIETLEPHGGGDEPEDLAGAFDLALQKHWEGFSRFAILATDAPCHGNEFHSKEMKDNYPEGDPEHRDIKELVRKFAQKNISLFCVKIDDITKQMFDIFEKEYEKGKHNDSSSQFTIQSCRDLCETIIEKSCEIYKNRKM